MLEGGRLPIPDLGQLPGPGGDFLAPSPASGMQLYLVLMARCWAQRPEDRPTFSDIITSLRCAGLCVIDGSTCKSGVELGSWQREKPIAPLGCAVSLRQLPVPEGRWRVLPVSGRLLRAWIKEAPQYRRCDMQYMQHHQPHAQSVLESLRLVRNQRLAGTCCRLWNEVAAGWWAAERNPPQQAAAVQLQLWVMRAFLMAVLAPALGARVPQQQHSLRPRRVPAAPKAAGSRPLGPALRCLGRVTPYDLCMPDFAPTNASVFRLLPSPSACNSLAWKDNEGP